jgi:signal transduction histidine kinase
MAALSFVQQRQRRIALALPWAIVILCTWSVFRVRHGDFETGFFAFLTIMSAVTAVLFAQRYRRSSPGVITACAGFVAWTVAWVLGLFPQFIAGLGLVDALWHIPPFIAAFGMMVLLVEEQVHATETAQKQLQHFTDVTSRLLSGVEVKSYCDQIAQIVTEATTFMRVAILLADDDQRLLVAGQAGWTEPDLAHLSKAVVRLTLPLAEGLCQSGRPIGQTAAVIVEVSEFEPYGAVRTTRRYVPNPCWRAGDELVVPLRSPQGNLVGLILLDDPRDPEQVTAEEASKIEMLAVDIAVATDNAAMQRQVMMSEKLAGLGQLVRGVAHEMNNPLTAVLGYADLLRQQTADPELLHGLDVIFRESQRMKDILGNLQRFAQQNHVQRRSLDLLPLLQELVRQRSHAARSRGIELACSFPSALPPILFDEARLKQVLANVLDNALEAVEQVPEKRVTVVARTEDNRVILSFTDTGPGFADMTRVFDPFFTTKTPGKGPGLGLSICYGIIKQHGGNITARNVHPTGACVTVELPATQATAAKTLGA